MITRRGILAGGFSFTSLAKELAETPDVDVKQGGPRSALHDSSLVNIHDFGAKGDGTSDDIQAFDDYRTYLLAQWRSGKPQRVFNLGFGRIYKVSRPVNWTGFNDFDFSCNHSVILGSYPDMPVVDMLGSTICRVSDLSIWVDKDKLCTCGIQIGRFDMNQGYPENVLSNVRIEGQFSVAAMINNGSEVLSTYDLRLVNTYAGNAETFSLVQDGINHWGVKSIYKDVRLLSDRYVSFNENVFYRPVFYHLGKGGAVWSAGSRRHKFDRGYVHLRNPASSACVLYFAGEGPQDEASRQVMFQWDVHSEISPRYIFQLAGKRDVILVQPVINDHLCQATESVIGVEANRGSLRLEGVDINLGGTLRPGLPLINDRRASMSGIFRLPASIALPDRNCSGLLFTEAGFRIMS